MKSSWKTEEELASAASGWLEADGWECFYEVCGGGGEPRADIVATLCRLVWVVECKLRLGLEVLAQADRWRRRGLAHFVSVAVPQGKQTDGSWFAERIARDRGIGVIRVPDPSCVEEGDVLYRDSSGPVAMTWSRWKVSEPAFLRRADVSRLRSQLTPERKASRPGSRGPYHTPFRETCNRVAEHVRKAGGRALVRDVLKGIDHHYTSDKSAVGALVPLVRKGIVPGLRIEQDGRALVFVTEVGS